MKKQKQQQQNQLFSVTNESKIKIIGYKVSHRKLSIKFKNWYYVNVGLTKVLLMFSNCYIVSTDLPKCHPFFLDHP